ncbi:copper oxidase, partial [Mesorhizobium sp. M1156]
MKRMIVAAVLTALSSGAALAGGSHAGGHGDKAATMPIGNPGEASKAKRTINISMSEKDDGKMLFQPAVLKVRKGETV